MTEPEEGYVPTFSHQPMPVAEPEPRGARQPAAPPYAPLGAAVAAAAAAIAPSFVNDTENVVADRLRGLRHVRDQLPSNTLVPRAELRDRAAKLAPLVDGWTWGAGNLLIVGPTGCGKTSAAALLVRQLLDHAARSRETFAPEQRRFWGGCASPFALADLIRWQSCRELSKTASEFPLGHGAPDAIQRCQHARLLVLEDLGATDDRVTLERILNVRYERRWPTITTSGLSRFELVSAFGEALVRRMSERAGIAGTIVNLFPAGNKP